MPPCVKSRAVLALYGLKFRTNAASPEPVATTQAWPAATRVGALQAETAKTASATPAVRVTMSLLGVFMWFAALSLKSGRPRNEAVRGWAEQSTGPGNGPSTGRHRGDNGG